MEKYDFSVVSDRAATPYDVIQLVRDLSKYGVVLLAERSDEYVDVLMETDYDRFAQFLVDYDFPDWCTPDLYRITMQ